METNQNAILIGWKEIEFFMRVSRNTLVKKNYPIKKENKGLVWAIPDELLQHRFTISSCKR